MPEAITLGLDLGTGGCKAVAVDADGAALASAFAGYETTFPANGWHEQRPDDWWDAVRTCCTELSTRLDDGLAAVRAVGLSGQSLAPVLVDAQGQLARQTVPIWSDARATAQARRTMGELEEDAWYLRTGNGFPTELYTAFEIAWLAEHEPDVLDATTVVLGSKDWVNLRMTGRVATDRSYASGSGVYDLAARRYDHELVAAIGVPERLLPEIVDPTHVLGAVTADAASELGLPREAVVVAGGVDNACMALGAGLLADGDAYIALGSSNWITLATREPVLDPTTRPFVFDHVVPGLYISALSTFGGGSSLAWLADVLHQDVAELLRAAEDVPPGSAGLLCLPTLAGGTVLEGGSHVRGAFVGLDLAHGAGHLTRAVVEGIALALGRAAEALTRHTELPPALPTVGGGARSTLLLQALADVLDRTIVRRQGDAESAAIGAAALAAVGAGLKPDLGAAVAPAVTTGETAPTDEGRELHRELAARHARVQSAIAALHAPTQDA
ncbi:FGGY-family carbohydrate kinase [Euzebya sp.]